MALRGQAAAPPSTAGAASAQVPPRPAPTGRVTVVPEHPIRPPRVPSGDSCQAPRGLHAGAPAPTGPQACSWTSRAQRQAPPRVPRPSTWESERGQRDGWADGAVSRLRTGKRDGVSGPQRPPPRRAGLSRGCPTYPARPSFGTAAGAHGQAGSGLGEREGHRPLGGGGERAAVESRWEGTASAVSAAVAMGEGQGGQGARAI